MTLAASNRASKSRLRRSPLPGLLGALFAAALSFPASLPAQILEIDLLRMIERSEPRYYIAERGELPPGYIMLGGVSTKGDSVETFLYPGFLESEFDLRPEYVEYDGRTGLIYRFRVPAQYFFSRKEERRELFFYAAPRDLAVPGSAIEIERFEDRIDAVKTASTRTVWIEDVRYNLQKEREDRAGTGLLSITIPIKLPKSVESIIGKGEETNLTVQGSEKIAISGRSDWCANCPRTEGQVTQEKFPDLNMEQELNVNLRGTIGEKINVEIQHASSGEGMPSTNRVRINYRGFEDDVVQLIEMGDTDLSLSGAQLVSYSGAAKGLFGVKAILKPGPLELTIIASKEEGETATGSFNSSGGQATETRINDYDFLDRQFFYFENPGDDFRQAGFGAIFPVIGGPGNDEIEVFVSLGATEPQSDFEYVGNAFVDVDNERFRDWNNPLNPSPDESLGFALYGRYKQLFIEDGDFVLIRDYSSTADNVRYIGIVLANQLEETRRLVVRYKARNVVTNEEYYVGNYRNYKPAASAQTGFVGKVICLQKSETTGQRATDPIWNMMMRNVYSLGSSQIDPQSLKISIEDLSNETNRNIHPPSGLNYLRIFGLDRVINATGEPGKDDLADGTLGVIDYDRGYIMFPSYEPFNPSEDVVDSFLVDEGDPRETDFDYTKLERDEGLYLQALTDQIKANNHKYAIVIESSSGQRVFQLAAFDIIEGSETVTVDGTRLARDVDYTIDYTSGVVTLKTLNVLPGAKINIDYQHKPLVGGGKNSLLGFNANLTLSENSRINGTFLYSAMGAPKYMPRLGEEPSRMMAADLNGSFVFHPSLMTRAANLLPRVDTDAQSTLNVGGEIAVSMPDPNVKGDASVDDMEGVEETSGVSMLRRSWYPASPAWAIVGGIDTLFGAEAQADYRWYNAARTGKQEYLITSRRDLNPGLDERENSTVTSLFLSAINPAPDQWCGVMTGFSGGGLDLSNAQYLEIWVNDFNTNFENDPSDPLHPPRGGVVHIDFGRIDEDFHRPDEDSFDNEDKNPAGWTIYEDTGFEGDGCTYPTDFSDANWVANESCYRGINCRKGNGMQDSEDLNSSNGLDPWNIYYTVTFDLAQAAAIDVQRDFPQSNPAFADYWFDPAKTLNPSKAWRKYRIDLSKAAAVSGEPRLDAVQHMRIWIERPDSIVSDTTVSFSDARVLEIADLQFIGSRWEFNGIRNLEDSLDASGAAPGQRLIIGTINNKDDASQYHAPYVVQEEEGIEIKEG